MLTLSRKVVKASCRLVRTRRRSSNNTIEANEGVISPSVQVTATPSDSVESSSQTPLPLPLLFTLARRWAWPAIHFRCESNPQEADAKYRDSGGDTVLHWACFGNPPLEPILALLHACPQLASATNHKGQLPLHVACSYRASCEVIQALIETYPEATGMPTFSGSYPLHLLSDFGCSVETLRAVLETDGALQTVSRFDGIFCRTPLALLNERKNIHEFHGLTFQLRNQRIRHLQLRQSRSGGGPETSENNTDDVILRRLDEIISTCKENNFWQKACLLIQAEYRGYIPDEEDAGSELVVHAACAIECPHSLLEFAALLYPEQLVQRDSQGRLPLHVACSKSNRIALCDVLFACPGAARVRDDEGNFPIQVAIHSGFGWNTGVSQLLSSYPTALEDLDLDDRLYPTILSKLSRTSEGLSPLYELVKSRPSLLVGRRDI